MRRRSGEISLPGFQPPEADVEFTAAELALIAAARTKFGLNLNEVDALNLARVDRQSVEARQRRKIDEITAQVGRNTRDGILAAKAAELGVSPDELQKLLLDPAEFRALMKMRVQAHLADVPTAKQFLADHRRRKTEQGEAAADRRQLVLNFSSKPPRGDDWRRMDKFGPMVAAEMTAEKKAKAALKKRLKDDRKPSRAPQPKKPSWKQKLAPSGKEAWLHFEQTGRGIVGDVINQESGKAAEVLEAERQLELWDEKREREGLDFAGFPWPKDED